VQDPEQLNRLVLFSDRIISILSISFIYGECNIVMTGIYRRTDIYRCPPPVFFMPGKEQVMSSESGFPV
jgi:hypothetical protein